MGRSRPSLSVLSPLKSDEGAPLKLDELSNWVAGILGRAFIEVTILYLGVRYVLREEAYIESADSIHT